MQMGYNRTFRETIALEKRYLFLLIIEHRLYNYENTYIRRLFGRYGPRSMPRAGVYSAIIARTHGWCEAISRGIILPRVHEVRSIGPRVNCSEPGTMKRRTPQEVHI